MACSPPLQSILISQLAPCLGNDASRIVDSVQAKTVRSKSTWILYTGYPYQDISIRIYSADLSQLAPCLSLSGLELRLVGQMPLVDGNPMRMAERQRRSLLQPAVGRSWVSVLSPATPPAALAEKRMYGAPRRFQTGLRLQSEGSLSVTSISSTADPRTRLIVSRQRWEMTQARPR